MGASVKASQHLGARRRRGRRNAPMSEINVTPFVDVMLVLLIIFMVAAPLLTVGVPIELPQAAGKQLQANKEPLTVSLSADGNVFIGDAKVELAELEEKLAKIARFDEAIFVRGDKGISYGAVMRVMGRISRSGYKKVSLVTEVEDGG